MIEKYQKEYFTNDSIVSRYTIRVGSLEATGYGPITASKKEMRDIACEAFFVAHQMQVPPTYKELFEAKPGIDYLTYSRASVLIDAEIHINDVNFFAQNNAIVAFDSEGADPPVLAQFCADPKHVYLFYLPQFNKKVAKILQDPKILKIVCDGEAEEKFFKFPLQNTVDVQGPERKSLVTRIKEVFNVELKKNKYIHMRGWRAPFTEDQIDYAAADAIWTLKLHLDK